KGQVSVYVQAGGNFVLKSPALSPPDSIFDVCGLATGDLNQDGADEIVTANCGQNNVTVYTNNGDGTFATGVDYAVAATGGESPANLFPYSLTVADVNGDGKNDIVVTEYYGADVTILT